MIEQDQLEAAQDATVYGTDGDKIGKAGQVYLDDDSGRPEWITVNTGLFGNNESFVPLREARLDGDRVVVPYDKDKVKGAPSVGADQHIDPDTEAELYRYYEVADEGHPHDDDSDVATEPLAAEEDRTVPAGRGEGHDTSGPDTDDAMTRSEEELRVGTERRESGRARLRKYVTTEEESVTVPVSHEEVRVEREPITDANAGDATEGDAISEEEHEVTLHEERPVVQKEAKPVERVRVGTETVTDEEQVTEEVRKEHIDVDEGDDRTTRD